MDRQTKPVSMANAARTSLTVLLLVSVVATLLLSLYCYGQVLAFHAGAQTLDATAINLWLPPAEGESIFGPRGMRFDARLATPLAGKQVIPMSGLYRVSAEAEGTHVSVLHNAQSGQFALKTPWNYVGAWFYAVLSGILLVAACCWITLVRHWTRSTRLVSRLSACCCLAFFVLLVETTYGQEAVKSPAPSESVAQPAQPTDQVGASTPTKAADEVEKTIKSLKLTKIFEATNNVASTFQDGRPREVIFAGKEAKVVLLPSETRLVELPKPVRVFYWQAGDAPVAVGDYEMPNRATHVWCHRTTDGQVVWKLYSAEAVDLNLQSAAIGLMLAKEAGNVVVGRIVPNSPAAREGTISIGDVIVGVSTGQKTITQSASPTEWTTDNVVALIRGRPGEAVTLEVVGPANPKGTPRKVILTREVLAEPKLVDIPSNGANSKSQVEMLNKLPYLNQLFKNPPRYQAHISCFNGKVDSRSSCSTTNFQKDGALLATGKMTCGLPGRVSEIEWSLLERRGDKDVYRFTRRFPSDTTDASTTSKDVEFSDCRVVVFEDEFQVVVIEPPKK